MNSTAIVIDGYTTPDNDSIVNCQFATKSVKYQFVEYKMVSSFSEQDYTTAGKGKSIIHYAPARVVFSNILYHANQTALVYTMVKIGSDGGGGVMYGFVFEREKDNWVLKKVGNESR